MTLHAAATDAGIVFSVTDTGIGISPAAQSRIFEAFHQAESSTTRRFGGTGLGLAICHQLVALMGGQLTLSSQVGEGTCMQFTLPLPQTEPVAARAVALPSMTGTRILLAEDNKINQKLACWLLHSVGCQVEVAENGREAVRRIREGNDYALILMDMRMPEMDGLEATRLIRQIPGVGETIPIIALTANAMREDREHCEAARDERLHPQALRSRRLLPDHRPLADRSALPREKGRSLRGGCGGP